MRVAAAAIGLVLTLLAPPLRAGTDPAREWFTLTTEHFAVHAYDGGEPLARRVARYCEEAHDALNPLLGWKPRERVHVVVKDDVDAANGFARVLPYDNITVFAHPPSMDSTLADYDDWLRLLVFHEYAHIAHLDHADGLPGFLNVVFGKVAKPNQALPRWLTEGIATWIESTRTDAGRVGSSRFEMFLRTAALAERLPELDELTGQPLQLPRGTSWYLYGGYLVDRLVEHAGEEAIGSFADRYGRRIVPFAMNILARRITGRDFREWYRGLLDEIRRRARRTAETRRERGLIRGERLTEGGEVKSHPRYTPDGTHLVYVRSTGHAAGHLVRAPASDPQEVTRILRCEGGCGRFAVGRDGRHVLLSSGRVHRQVDRYDDLFRVRLEPHRPHGEGERLTWGRRTAQPRLGPKGRLVWVVRNRWGRTWLEALRASDGELVHRWRPPEGARVDAPLPHPDGRRVFATMHHEGNRDLVEIDLPSGRWRRLTWGRSLEIDPTLSRDGRWLVYASDATGVYDLYARDVSGEPDRAGRTRRLTRVLGGAFEPTLAPSGDELVYVGWTVEGEELYRMPFRPEEGERVPVPDPRSGRRGEEPPADVRVSDRSRFRFGPTLRPRSWEPSFSADSSGLARLGLRLTGSEVSERVDLAAEAEWDFGSRRVAASASARIGLGYPDLSLRVGRFVRGQQSFFADQVHGFGEKVIFGSADLSLPLPDVHVNTSVSAGFNVEYRRHDEAPEVEHAPDERTPSIPEAGLTTSMDLSWRFNDVERYVYSISPAWGTSGGMSIRLRHPWIGSDGESWTVRADLQRYVPLPWADDHVLSAQLRAGWAGGEPGRRGLFGIGGVPEQSLLTDLLNQVHAGSVWLRGFPESGFRGRGFELLTSEYRLPLYRIREGVDTLPIFANDLSAAVFSDVGLVHDVPLERPVRDDLHAGIGAELRLGMELFYGFPASFRLGYAHGFGDRGIDHVYFLMAGQP